jgi:hypothetical protein
MAKQSLGAYVFIEKNECPSMEAMESAIRRLRKDIASIGQFTGYAEWRLDHLQQVVDFLDFMIKTSGKRLKMQSNKDEKNSNNS